MQSMNCASNEELTMILIILTICDNLRDYCHIYGIFDYFKTKCFLMCPNEVTFGSTLSKILLLIIVCM